MKKILSIAFLAILSITPAYADRGGGRGGGWGWRGDWIFPALITGALVYELSRPQPIYVQPAPVYAPGYVPGYAPSYVQNNAPAIASSAMQYWYFCAAANAYYPYVTSCPSGWQAIPTTPPAALPSAPYGLPPR